MVHCYAVWEGDYVDIAVMYLMQQYALFGYRREVETTTRYILSRKQQLDIVSEVNTVCSDN